MIIINSTDIQFLIGHNSPNCRKCVFRMILTSWADASGQPVLAWTAAGLAVIWRWRGEGKF